MQKKHRCFVSMLGLMLLTMFYFPASSLAETKKRLAILDFTALHTSEKIAKSVRDMLEVEIYKSGHYHIVEKDVLQFMLQEQKSTWDTCSEPECAARIGNAFQVDTILTGSVRKTGRYYIVAIKLIDVGSGLVVYADTLHLRSATSFEAEVKSLSQSVVTRSPVYKKENIVLLPPDFTYQGYYMRGIMPGWGQMYVGQHYKGSLIMGAFVLAAAYSVYTVYDFREKRSEYDSLSAESDTKKKIDDTYDASEKAFRRANISFGILGLIYIMNWMDILFISKPVIGPQLTFYLDDESSLYFSLPEVRSGRAELGCWLTYERRF